jgi:hypothetical protein
MHATELSVSGPPRTSGAATTAPQLSFDSNVPRTMVHKSAVSEVFLTDACRVEQNRFAIAAQWPRDHVFFQPGADGTSDPLLWIETIRQAGIYLSHRFYGVPLDHPFILASVNFAIDNPKPPRHGLTPVAVTLDATCHVRSHDERRLVISMEATVLIDGRRVGQVDMAWQAVDPRRYALVRFRGGKPAPHTDAPAVHATVPLPPEAIGRRQNRDVLLAGAVGTGRVWNLRLDPGHPVLFDHGSDHIPGLALIEAFSQAAALTSQNQDGPAPRVWALKSGAITFETFGELGVPVIVVSRDDRHAPADDTDHERRVAALQGERPLATAVLRGIALSPLDIAGGAPC